MTYSRKLSGSLSKVPVGDEAVNNTGSTLNKVTPISINHTTGEADLIDVSLETSARASFAIVREDAADGAPLEYITIGRIEDVSLAFDYGDPVYVSKTGGLTNIPPEIGVGGFISGDFIISVGIIAKNINDPAKKDLIVNMDVEGQLG